MPINPDAVGTTTVPQQVTWTPKDCLLYALGVGAGSEDAGEELQFTTENSEGVRQRVLPTFPVVLGGSGAVLDAAGTFDRSMMVHGEQSVSTHGELPVEGSVTVVSRLAAVFDKGSGAVVQIASDATDPCTGRRVWSTSSSAFIRGEGGFGGNRGPSTARPAPQREPDHIVRYGVRQDQALLYRLSGDRNPLHSDPAFAARAGFDRPILHGLCTFGFTGRALLHVLCDDEPARFVSASGRFSRPVLPGEALTIRIWRTGDGEGQFTTETAAGVVMDSGSVSFDAV